MLIGAEFGNCVNVTLARRMKNEWFYSNVSLEHDRTRECSKINLLTVPSFDSALKTTISKVVLLEEASRYWILGPVVADFINFFAGARRVATGILVTLRSNLLACRNGWAALSIPFPNLLWQQLCYQKAKEGWKK